MRSRRSLPGTFDGIRVGSWARVWRFAAADAFMIPISLHSTRKSPVAIATYRQFMLTKHGLGSEFDVALRFCAGRDSVALALSILHPRLPRCGATLHFVIPRACDPFRSLRVFCTPNRTFFCFSTANKTVILSEAPRRSIAQRTGYGAESKDLGSACLHPCCSELFNHRNRHRQPATVFPWGAGSKNFLAS
jgi:hypothetical protein